MNLNFLMNNHDGDCSNNDNSNTFGQLDEDVNPYNVLDEAYDSLPREEKHRVRDDLYGKENNFTIEETESFAQSKLRELDYEISKIDNADERKRPYLLAVQQEQAAIHACSGAYEPYVTSTQFRIMFLRSELYNTPLTAQRMLKHFQEKLRLFGEKKLASRIRKEDLNEKDKQVLYSGVICMNGATDSSGRLIFWLNRREVLNYGHLELQKIYFYLFQFFIEQSTHNAQKTGIVIIQDWSVAQTNFSDIYRFIKYISLTAIVNFALPIRVVARHVLFTSTYEHTLINSYLRFQPKSAISRVIPHYYPSASLMHFFKQDLQEYGIYLDDTNTSNDNSANTSNAAAAHSSVGNANVRNDNDDGNDNRSSRVAAATTTNIDDSLLCHNGKEGGTIPIAESSATPAADVTTASIKNDENCVNNNDNNDIENNDNNDMDSNDGGKMIFLPLKENCDVNIELLKHQFDSILL